MRRTVLVAVAALLAAGCGGGPARSADTLVIAAWDAGEESALDVAAADFEKANAGVDVKLVKTPWDQHMQALRRQLSTDAAPDVAVTILGYGEAASSRGLADLGLLADLGEPAWSGRVPESDRFLIGDDTGTYALPLDYVAIGAFYLPKVFADEGLSVPATFSEVLDLCATAADRGKVAFAMGAQEGAGMPHFLGFALAATLVYGENPDFGEQWLAGETTFAESADWHQTLRRFGDMTKAGCFGEGSAGSTREAASQALGRGEALVAVAPTVTLPLFQGAAPDATFEMFPLPATDDPDQLRVVAAPATGMVVPRQAANSELGKRFLDFYAGNRARYSEIDDSVPGVPVNDEDSRVPPFATALGPYVRDGKTAPVADATWPSPEMLTAFSDGLVDILLGGSATDSAADDVLTRMDAARPAGK